MVDGVVVVLAVVVAVVVVVVDADATELAAEAGVTAAAFLGAVKSMTLPLLS